MRIVKLVSLGMLLSGLLAGCGDMPDESSGKGVVETKGAYTSGFTFHNYQTGLCLGVAGGTPTYGNTFITWRCDNSANQAFQIRGTTAAPAGYAELMNLVSANICMNSAGPALDRCWDHDYNQDVYTDDWKLIPVLNDIHGNTCYNIQATYGQVVGVSGGSTKEGAPVIMWSNFHDPVRHPDQLWCVY